MGLMGLFESLFGSSSKLESVPKQQPELVAIVKETLDNIQPEAVGSAAVSAELNTEIVAVIAASINCVMDTSIALNFGGHYDCGRPSR